MCSSNIDSFNSDRKHFLSGVISFTFNTSYTVLYVNMHFHNDILILLLMINIIIFHNSSARKYCREMNMPTNSTARGAKMKS